MTWVVVAVTVYNAIQAGNDRRAARRRQRV